MRTLNRGMSTKTKAPPRRERVERGIYLRLPRTRPLVYEVTYTDRHGKQRWATSSTGGVTAARGLRQELMVAGGPETKPARDTFATVAEAYLETKQHLARSTREGYRTAFDKHLKPTFGTTPIAAIDADAVAAWVSKQRASGAADWSVRTRWTVLTGVLRHAARRGLIPENPCNVLEPGERPSAGGHSMRFLDRDELEQLLEHADIGKPLLATALFTGMRMGELLGLRWANVDTKNGFVKVRKQLNSHGELVDPKTEAAKRDIVLMPALASLLRSHRIVTRHSTEDDPVFASMRGTPLQRKKARTLLQDAVDAAELGTMRFHDLRHTFASILIVGQKQDPVSVAGQMGHEKASTTLDTYSKLFDKARNADTARAALERDFGALLG